MAAKQNQSLRAFVGLPEPPCLARPCQALPPTLGSFEANQASVEELLAKQEEAKKEEEALRECKTLCTNFYTLKAWVFSGSEETLNLV